MRRKTGVAWVVQTKTACTDHISELRLWGEKGRQNKDRLDWSHASIRTLLRAPHLCEIHAQTNLREQMHDDALVLLHRLAFAFIITVVMAIKWI